MRLKHKISYFSLGILAFVSIAITLAAVLTINQLLGELNETNMRSEMTRIKYKLERVYLTLRQGDVDDRGIHTDAARQVFFDFFETYPQQSRMLMIRSDTGSVIYPRNFVATIRESPSLFFGISDTNSGFERFYYDGEPFLFVYDYFKPLKWQVVLAASEGEVFKRRDSFLRSVSIILFAGLLLGGFLSIAIARSIANPLARLAEATTDFSPGVADKVLPDRSSTEEVGDLTRAFKKMTGRLKSAYDAIEAQTLDLKIANERLTREVAQRKQAQQELATLNKELEKLVAARTWDLQHKAAELQDANRMLLKQDALKSSFLSSVSHEFRTPLTSILGFVKLIKKDYLKIFRNTDAMVADSSDKVIRIRENLDVIQDESERLSRLIDDFLDFAKIEAGRFEWHDRRVDLVDGILQAVSAIEGVFGEKNGVELRLDLPENLPKMWVDPDRFKQLMINLISNALKYTDTGRVSISAGYFADTVQFCVLDSGRGVPREELSMVFEKFHQVQVNDTLTPQSKGTGLGLSICRQIVEHYDGLIWMESSLGKGSAVYLEFPLLS